MVDSTTITTETFNEVNHKDKDKVIHSPNKIGMTGLDDELNTDLNSNSLSVSEIYQPFSYDAYKFFVKSSPYVEKIILNNINKIIRQNVNKGESQETSTGLNKLEKEFIMPNDLLNYININNLPNCDTCFNSKYL
jgi:hypothetical protein